MHRDDTPFLSSPALSYRGVVMTLLPSACCGCQQRDQEIANLQQEIQHLRQQLEQARREGHRQAGKFRRRCLKKKGKKPGRRRGHPADLRPRPSPERIDRVIEVPCRHCAECRTALVDPGVVVQYQTDLPPIVPIVTQFNIETGYCPCCQQRHQGGHTEQISNAVGAAGNTLGPVVLTMAAELKHRLGVPYRKISDFLETYCELPVAPATFVRAEQRLAELAQPTYQLLLDALRQAGVVHADETGWRIGRVNAWLWVFSSKDITIYAIRTSRGHEVPEELLGPDFNGVLVVDGLKTYTVLEYYKAQCNAHLLRRCKELSETVSAPEAKHLDTLVTLLREAIAWAQRRDDLSLTRYARRVQELEDRLDAWLDSNLLRPTLSPELDRLDRHIRNHRGEWFVFLHEPAVPPTNNHAESMLRPAVISRKIGGCNKTMLGALVHGVLSSLMVTCRQRGQQFLDLARKLWRGGEPKAIPLPPPLSP
jgi:transposase